MQDESEDRTKQRSLAHLIIWISVCLLCAAWGPVMSNSLRTTWAKFGMFGMAAGVGLNAIDRVRRTRQEKMFRRSLQTYAQEALVKFTSDIVRVESDKDDHGRMSREETRSDSKQDSAFYRSRAKAI
jgi:hypothetical protein